MPDVGVIAYVINAGNLVSEADAKVVVDSARAIGCEVDVVRVKKEQDIDAAMAAIAQRRIPAVLQGDAFFSSRANQIIKLAERYAIPIMHPTRASVVAGGLIAYAPDVIEMTRTAGLYAGRILKGDRPADLPVQQPTKYVLTINLRTAKKLGIAVPLTLLARADEVIE